MSTKQSTASALRRIAAFLRPHLASYVTGIVGIGFANFFMNLFLARMLMDLTQGIMEMSRAKLSVTTQLMVGGTLFMAAWVAFAGRLLVFSNHKTGNDIRRALFRKYIEAPLAEIEKRHSGDLVSRATTSMRQVNSLLAGEIQSFTNIFLSGVGSAAYMIILDVRMGLAGIVCGMVPLVVNLPFASPLRRASTLSQETQARFAEAVSDLLTGRDTIRHMNLGDYASGRAVSTSRDVLSAGMKQVRLSAARSLAEGISELSSLAFFVYVAMLGVKNTNLIPAAVAVTQLSNPVRRLFGSIGSIISNIQTNMGGVQRVVEALELPSEPTCYSNEGVAREAQQPQPQAQTAVLRVEDLSFTYQRSGKPALSGISFSLERGQQTALVGPSGGGKSTLVKVIMGLYPPTSGDIVAFGKSIYDVPLHEWRHFFSYVPQNAFLFAGTVYENILGGMDDPGLDRVIEVARMANAHDFIMALPDGYNSVVSERASNLSGGQRQRIAIARTLLRDAPILLLDEATASLDTESEVQVQEALDRLMADRTTLVVAHRLSTVRKAAEILVMADGAVVERGRHDDLIALGGVYKQLVDEGLGKKPGS